MIKFIVLLIISTSILADSHEPNKVIDDLDIHGYIGYRHVWSSIGHTPTPSYPEIGLLLNYDLSKHLSIFTQFNINESGIDESPEHLVTYSFLKYQSYINSIAFEIIAGKLRHEIGLNNSNIVNPQTRPGVIAPQSIYWNRLSQTLISGYGINLNIYINDFKFAYTIDKYIMVNEKEESLIWTGIDSIKLDPYFGSHQIYNLNYRPDTNYEIKASFSILKMNKDFEKIKILTLGYQYDNSDFNIALETVIFKPGDTKYSHFDELRYGYSATFGYNLYEDLEIHINYNTFRNSNIYLGLNHTNGDANKWQDYSIGITKDFEHFEFRADIHKVYGGRILESSAWESDDIKSWWYAGSSLVYHF